MTYTTDKVVEKDSLNEFPTPGESKTIYIDTSSSKAYRWTGNKYMEIHLSASPEVETRLSQHYYHQAKDLRAQVAALKKNDAEAQAALGIVAIANRRVGYAAMILFVMWLNGFRYLSGGWEYFFSLFGYTVYLSLIRTVDWFSGYGGGFVNALVGWLESASKQCL